MMRRHARHAVIATPLMALALALAASPATVQQATASQDGTGQISPQDRYVQQVEPICRQNTRANGRILKGVRAKVKQGRLAVAARQFARAGTAFDQTLRRVKAVPRPQEDRAALGKWIGLLGKQSGYLRQIATALRREQTFQADRLSLLLLRNARQANDAVFGFDFKDCVLRPGRFL